MIINLKFFFDYGKNSGLVRRRDSQISRAIYFPTSILPGGWPFVWNLCMWAGKGSGPCGLASWQSWAAMLSDELRLWGRPSCRWPLARTSRIMLSWHGSTLANWLSLPMYCILLGISFLCLLSPLGFLAWALPGNSSQTQAPAPVLCIMAGSLLLSFQPLGHPLVLCVIHLTPPGPSLTSRAPDWL